MQPMLFAGVYLSSKTLLSSKNIYLPRKVHSPRIPSFEKRILRLVFGVFQGPKLGRPPASRVGVINLCL